MHDVCALAIKSFDTFTKSKQSIPGPKPPKSSSQYIPELEYFSSELVLFQFRCGIFVKFGALVPALTAPTRHHWGHRDVLGLAFASENYDISESPHGVSSKGVLKNISQNGIISSGMDENKKYLKPPMQKHLWGEQSHYQNHRFRGDGRHGDVAMKVRSRIRPLVPATSTQEKHLNHTAAGIGKTHPK